MSIRMSRLRVSRIVLLVFVAGASALAGADNTNGAGAGLYLSGGAPWSGATQPLGSGASGILAGTAGTGVESASGSGARLWINPLDVSVALAAPGPPVITTNGGAAFLTNVSPVVIAGSTEVSTEELRLNGSAIAGYVSGAAGWSAAVPLAEGPNVLSFTAANLAGESAAAVIVVTYDSVAPTFTNVSALPSVVMVDATASLAFDASEALSGPPDVFVNGNAAAFVSSAKAGSAYEYEYTVLQGDPLGPAQIEINAVDLAGNAGQLANNTALSIVSENHVPLGNRAALLLALCLTVLGAGTLYRRRQH